MVRMRCPRISPSSLLKPVIVTNRLGIHGWNNLPNTARNGFSRFREKDCRVQSIWMQRGKALQLPQLTLMQGRGISDMKCANSNVGETIFKILKLQDSDHVSINELLEIIDGTGIKLSDPRLEEFMRRLQEEKLLDIDEIQDLSSPLKVKKQAFLHCIEPVTELLSRCLCHEFVIPEWKDFTVRVSQIFKSCAELRTGVVADYTPQLARADPDLWGASVCSVDGQRFSLGDAYTRICLHSALYPLAYSLAQHEHGEKFVHSYVGHEPAGLPHSSIALNKDRKPHNPLILTGALMTSSLLSMNAECIADRFDKVMSHLKRLCGYDYIGFDNGTFLAEREASNRKKAVGYILKEQKCLPENANIPEIMDFYFQLRAIEVTCHSGAVIAATLANGGICPTTGERVLDGDAVRDTLSLMYSCGMYDYSGRFQFRVGLPCKSSISGIILLIVPNVLGMCIFSPPLSDYRSSVRGMKFCEELVKEFNFHYYDSLRFLEKKCDPRRKSYEARTRDIMSLLFSSYHHDVTALRREHLQGVDMEQADYDGRTALHIAAAEGHLEVVRFLILTCNVKKDPLDRWNSTPLQEAKRFGHQSVVDFLSSLP